MGRKDEKNKSSSTKKKKRVSRKELLRRKQRRNKIIILAAVAAAVILAVMFIPKLTAVFQENSQNVSESGVVLEDVDISELKHLSFDILSVESSDTRMSAEEFSEALIQLYNDGYVLVDVYDIVNISEDGSFSYKDTISIPEGKRPLIISQSDVCYPMNSQESGVADKLVLDNGQIKAQYTNASGSVLTGDYDLVPVLESFIESHEDFSFEGARAILGVNGSTGVFGYRTTSYFSGTGNNPYADYGAFDTESETESAIEIADKLKELGYHFACYGFADDISYGAEYSIVESDIEQWTAEVVPVTGETDIIILPRQTDIGSWSGYDGDNRKYELLSESGFKFYFVGNNSTPNMLQVRDGYVRQTVYEVHTGVDFENAKAWL